MTNTRQSRQPGVGPANEVLQIVNARDFVRRRQRRQASISRRPRPWEPNNGFSTSGRSGRASRAPPLAPPPSTRSLQVAGVGMPCLCSRKLVIDLSTQRSMARASLCTGTPSSRRACSTPSRMVTCSKLPVEIVRTNTAVGQVHRRNRAGATRDRRRRRESRSLPATMTSHSTPCAVKACFSRRVCQSALSTKIATLGRGIAEGLVDQASSSAPPWKVRPLSSAVTVAAAGLNSSRSMA